MKKIGVFILLSLMALSSVQLFASMNLTSDSNPLSPLDETSEVLDEDQTDDKEIVEYTDQPIASTGGGVNDYFMEQIPFHWYDLEHNNTMYPAMFYNITNMFTNGKDDGYYNVPLAPTIKFFDQWFSNAYISTNGYISFSDFSPTLYNEVPFPTTASETAYMVAPFWDDIDLNSIGHGMKGEVYYSNIGSKLIVEYKNVTHHDGSYIGSFEVAFRPDGIIEFHFAQVKYTAAGVTCGLNYGDGETGSSFGMPASLINFSMAFSEKKVLFYDDFEDPIKSENSWDGIDDYPNNYWAINDRNWNSWNHSLGCANFSRYPESYERYVGGASQRVNDQVIIKDLDLRDLTEAYLNYWYVKETTESGNYDQFRINVKIDSDQFFLDPEYANHSNFVVEVISTTSATWMQRTINLSFFCGYDDVDIIFIFDTQDGITNNGKGVKIDDVEISGTRRNMIMNSQIAVSTGSILFYDITYMDLNNYQYYFHEPGFGDQGQEIKLKITSLTGYTDRWDMGMKLWLPDTDFNDQNAARDISSSIWKKGINMKSGFSFFVPYGASNELGKYLQDADNVEQWYGAGNLQYNSWYNYDSYYNIHTLELIFDNFRVQLYYNSYGILTKMVAFQNDYAYQNDKIFELVYDPKDPVEDNYEQNDNRYDAKIIEEGLIQELACNDEDWYKISMFVDEILDVTVYFSNDLGNLQLYMYADDNSLINSSTSATDNEYLSYKAVYAGYVFIRIIYADKKNYYDLEITIEGKSATRVIPIFFDNFEQGVKSKWTGIGSKNWHISTIDTTAPSPIRSLYCGNEQARKYSEDDPYNDTATINHLNLMGYYSAKLAMYVKKDTGGRPEDYLRIAITIKGNAFYMNVKYAEFRVVLDEIKDDTYLQTSAQLKWDPFEYDLSPFCGYDDVNVEFTFYSTSVNNTDLGVMIDNINITGSVRNSYNAKPLCVKEGDEFIYNIEAADPVMYSNIFGEPFGEVGDKLKIKIQKITNTSLGWDVKARFWDPNDDLDKMGTSDEYTFKVYMNPHNYKTGTDFFIPCGDIANYLLGADNVRDYISLSEFGRLSINASENNYRINYGYIEISKYYNENGILGELNIGFSSGGENGYIDLLTIRLEGYTGEGDDRTGPSLNDALVQIPGYDIYFITIISVVSIVLISRRMKSKRNTGY